MQFLLLCIALSRPKILWPIFDRPIDRHIVKTVKSCLEHLKTSKSIKNWKSKICTKPKLSSIYTEENKKCGYDILQIKQLFRSFPLFKLLNKSATLKTNLQRLLSWCTISTIAFERIQMIYYSLYGHKVFHNRSDICRVSFPFCRSFQT